MSDKYRKLSKEIESTLLDKGYDASVSVNRSTDITTVSASREIDGRSYDFHLNFDSSILNHSEADIARIALKEIDQCFRESEKRIRGEQSDR